MHAIEGGHWSMMGVRGDYLAELFAWVIVECDKARRPLALECFCRSFLNHLGRFRNSTNRRILCLVFPENLPPTIVGWSFAWFLTSAMLGLGDRLL